MFSISYLLANPFAIVIILLGLAWAWYSCKDFISWFKVDKLTKEQEAVEKKIEEIPKEVENQTVDQNVDFWNKKDPNSGV